MKEIKLTKGKIALVDDCDFDYLNKWRWYAVKGLHTYYAVRGQYYRKDGKKKSKLISMHRVILELNSPEKLADHKDGNGLNNQRNNLRVATRAQNNSNKCAIQNAKATSKFIGVSWKTQSKKWRAHMSHNKKAYHIGYFENEVDAAEAYKKKAKELHGEFASYELDRTG